jgi:hypothetical protein
MPANRREVSSIPAWAYVIAGIIFICIPVIFFTMVWPDESEMPRFPLQVLISFMPGTILAFMALMVGYVNRDAGRRGMNRTLWTLLVIFIPNAIGFILYFLLRSPLRTACPKCGTTVEPNVNFCPNCRYTLHPTCAQCRSAVRRNDTFCANCGAQLDQVAS